ncbi:MAG: prephenate dehydrogenase [Clostridia bacterium]|nr:prephenate dehydrogenase [Clostridia bacterium]
MIYKIAVVGLGIIGGSVAKALRGFRGGAVYAQERDKGVLLKAQECGAIEGEAELSECDSVILALYPSDCVQFMRENMNSFKSGAVIWDVCGVKGSVVEPIRSFLRDDIEFVGAHPMSGREKSGFAASDGRLFENSNFIITPCGASDKAVQTVKEMAAYMGCSNIVVTDCDKHDAMIAYTSQLMHAVAVALCKNPCIEEAGQYSAGSLRDCTRVADINDALWSELFVENAPALCSCVENLTENLNVISRMAREGRREELAEFLRSSAAAKRKYLLEVN